MNNSHGLMSKALAGVGAGVLLALVPLGLNRLARKNSANSFPAPPMRDPSTRGEVRASLLPGDEAAALAHPTPPVAARPDDLYEDVTDQAGLKFVNQYCDTRIANILESNGAGGAVLDFDNDGDLDIIIANGDAFHLAGRESLLIKNEGDGKFLDVLPKAAPASRRKSVPVAAPCSTSTTTARWTPSSPRWVTAASS